MKFKNRALFIIAVPALATLLCLGGCSSDDDASADGTATDGKPAAKKTSSTSSKASEFFKAVDSSLDKSRVKSDNGDMYRFKNDDTVIFHKERRSDSLLDKNETIDPSYR